MKLSKETTKRSDFSQRSSSSESIKSDSKEESSSNKARSVGGSNQDRFMRKSMKAKTLISDKSKFTAKVEQNFKEKRAGRTTRKRAKNLSKAAEKTNSLNLEHIIEKFLQKKLEEIIEDKGSYLSGDLDEGLVNMLRNLFKTFEEEFQNILVNSMFRIMRDLYGPQSIVVKSTAQQKPPSRNENWKFKYPSRSSSPRNKRVKPIETVAR
jgi:hypothetical protein